MLTLVLVRHGETPLNAERRYQGWIDSPLSERGAAQAAALADVLRHALIAETAARTAPSAPMVYASESLRTMQTASLALPGAAVVVESRLRELDFGAFDGRTYEENLEAHGDLFRAWIDDPAGVRPPGGETLPELEARIADWLGALPHHGRVIAFTHAGPIHAILARLLRVPFVAAHRHGAAPGDALRLIVPAHRTGPIRPPVRLQDLTGGCRRHRAAPPLERTVCDIGASDARPAVTDHPLIDNTYTEEAMTDLNPSRPIEARPRHPRAPRPKQRTPGPYRLPPRERRHGLVIVNTGDGKGKTTAALGLLLRAAGRDMRVAMLQFIKTAEVERGEHVAARRLGVEILPLGAGFTWLSENIEEDRRLARECWARCVEVLGSGNYDIVIFDELTYALAYDWLTHQEVFDTLRSRPKGTHVVITGRRATPELIEFADLVTEMREVKHPYRTQGIGAQPGIEL